MKDNQRIFYHCCKSLACIESSIKTLEGIGLLVNPKENKDNPCFSDYLYQSCDGMIDAAMYFLDIPSIKEYDKVYNDILSASIDTYEEIMEDAWNKYGHK